MLGNLEGAFARRARKSLQALLGMAGKGPAGRSGKNAALVGNGSHAALEDAAKLGSTAAKDVLVEAEVTDMARHFRLTESPKLVEQLARLDGFWGRDVTRQLAREHQGHRGGFLADLVANAERRGYQDLEGLQESIPRHWLSRAPCPFCHAHEVLEPKGSRIFESENFVAAPNIRQLFAQEGEEGGHVMLFAKHHRSTPSGLPGELRRELVDSLHQTKKAMEAAYGKPVSLFANGMPGAEKWLLEDVDTHAHIQLFTGNATVTEAVLRETGFGRDRVIPVGSLEDYFQLYDAGKLRGRYILTLDARLRGHVILIGDTPTAGGLAMRNARVSLGLPPLPKIDPNAGKALAVATLLQSEFKRAADAAGVRAILATAPVPVRQGH